MQPTAVQPADPQNDPHDDIVAILRNDPAPRMAHDPSELRITPADHVASTAPDGPPLKTTVRAVPPNDKPGSNDGARRRPGRRFARFLFTIAIGAAATIAWQSYGEAAREMLATYVPQLVASATGQAQDETGAAEAQVTPTAETAAEAAPAQPAAADTTAAPATITQAAATPDSAVPAQAAAPQPAPPQAAAAPDLAPLIENMSREIASLRETIEQLKSGQQQISRDLAKAVEQDTKRKTTSSREQPTRAAAAPPRSPPPPPTRSAQPPPPPPVYRQVEAGPPPQRLVPPPPGYYAPAPRPPRSLP